jgi:hypothetical protein
MASLSKGLIAQSELSTVLIKIQDSLFIGIPIEQAYLIPKATEALKTYELLYVNEYELNKYKDQMIIAYSEIVGVQAQTVEELKALAANKKAIDQQKITDLNQTIEDQNKALKKAKFKGIKRTAIGSFLGLAGGIILAKFL